ncbi:MAG TPA: GlsB/YeaQ/YmgE family stress response membrane protein [Ignavibacteriaceae bacterium]|nr:GlsB/YeaQ/YmgE family stress response membrane protein [Ignavibacteriaceae bacterium]
MSLPDLFLLLIIAGIVGSIGESITGYSRGGCFVSIAVGFIGALLGSWMAKKFNLPEIFQLSVGKVAFPIIWAIIGAIVFTLILRLLTPRKRI